MFVRKLLLAAGAWCALFGISPAASGQATGTISGTVTDAVGVLRFPARR